MTTETDGDSDAERGCRRCGNDEAAVGEIAVSNRGYEAMADLDLRNIQVIYCTDCGYTEHYHSDAGADALADLFFTDLADRDG
jgi:predicted nucleic-acid-binding Zn-ribbon protein